MVLLLAATALVAACTPGTQSTSSPGASEPGVMEPSVSPEMPSEEITLEPSPAAS